MKHQIILIKLLSFGIATSLIFALNSCKTISESPVYENFIYKNKSGQAITIEKFFLDQKQVFDLSSNDSLELHVELIFGSIDGIIAYADSVNIIFNKDDKKLSFDKSDHSETNILNKDNYTYSKSRNKHIYRYTFNEKDYSNVESTIKNNQDNHEK